MKKIKLSANWDTSELITERLITQFKTPEIDLSEIKFVYDDDYDIIVFFNYVNEKIKLGAKSYLFPHEPTWNGSHQKTFNDDTVVFGFKKELYYGNCIELVSHTFYGGRGPWIDPLYFWSYENLITYKFNKTNNISSSITKLENDYGPTCLYPQRYKLSNMIDSLSFIDVYDGLKRSPKRHDSLVSYKFNISIENEYMDNWLTEKFYDCILTDTIPIYFGCKNIKDIYPEDGYILINDINNIDEIKDLLEYVNSNSDMLYDQKINGLKLIKEKYFSKNNLLKKIIEL